MRKRYTPTFKAQVVQEILKEDKTIAQIASEYARVDPFVKILLANSELAR